MSAKLDARPELFEELRAQSQHRLIQFFEAELQLGYTFVDSAVYQPGKR